MDLETFWFLMLGVLLIGYAILDGFDLGVGILHLAARKDEERRISMNAIGPLWDGNEVWLIAFGGALFAVFPDAYATVFSGFYLPFMILLCALIFRGLSLEFRSKQSWPLWRRFWDGAFSISSLVAALLFGITAGNLIQGIPVGPDKEYAGGFWTLLGFYPLLVGCFVVALFAMHGALYLCLKTEGDIQRRVVRMSWYGFAVFLLLYVLIGSMTVRHSPLVTKNLAAHPWIWGIVVLNVLAIAAIPHSVFRRRYFYAFLASSCTIAALVFLLGMSIFPNLVISNLNPSWSLTIYNAASSEGTLKLMRLFALISMPLIITYTAVIYWIFKGKVVLTDTSY